MTENARTVTFSAAELEAFHAWIRVRGSMSTGDGIDDAVKWLLGLADRVRLEREMRK